MFSPRLINYVKKKKILPEATSPLSDVRALIGSRTFSLLGRPVGNLLIGNTLSGTDSPPTFSKILFPCKYS